MIGTTSLMDLVKEQLASNTLQLPVLAPSALELQDLLAREDVVIEDVANHIMQDQALATQVLRLANSAFYGGLKQISTIKEAIMRLGTKEVMNLVLLTTQRQNYGANDEFIKPYVGSLWKHASSCATGAKFLAKRLGHEEVAQEAFMGGLLHDIGHLFLLKVMETIHSSQKEEGGLSSAVLGEVLDNMHATQGTLLLQQWNLPQVYCDVTSLHHQPDYDCSNNVVTLVRLANMACHQLGIGLHKDPSIVLATTEEAKILQAPEVVLAELEIMLEDAAAAAGTA